MDDPKRLISVLNRSALQREDPPVYQTIRGLIDVANELQGKIPLVIPPITATAGVAMHGQQLELTTNARRRGLEFIIDGGDQVLTPGVKGEKVVPYTCGISGIDLLADQSGSIALDIWRTTFPGYPPTAANSITGSDPPVLTNAQALRDERLTGWQRRLEAGDVLRFVVKSAATITRVTLSLALELEA